MSFFIKHHFVAMSLFFLVLAISLLIFSGKRLEIDYFLENALFLDDVLLYVMALETLKWSLINRNSFKWLRFDPNEVNNSQTRLLSLVSAFPFGLGVSSFLKGVSISHIRTKPVSEGMTSSMFIYPTTLASGYVFDYFRIDSILSLFLFGILVCILVLIPINRQDLNDLWSKNIFKLVLFLGIINYVYLLFISEFIEHYFMIKQSIFFMVLSIILNPNCLKSLFSIIYGTRKLLVFFICVGILGSTFIQVVIGLNLINGVLIIGKHVQMILIRNGLRYSRSNRTTKIFIYRYSYEAQIAR